MRFAIVLLMCLISLACGKTGALYLPEEPVDESAEVQQPDPAAEDNPGAEENSN